MEYQDPGNAIPEPEDWHWVFGTGVKVGSEGLGSNVNVQFVNPPIPDSVTELRIRYKSGPDNGPWIYGPEISRKFQPCGFTPAPTPCNCPTPAPTPQPTNPPTPCNCLTPANPPDVNQSTTVTVNSTSGSGSTSTSSGGGSGGSCCSHGCCDEGDVTQTQGGQHQEINGPLVTINGAPAPCAKTCEQGNGDSDFWDWWWLIPAALIVLAIAAVVGLFMRGRGDRGERTTSRSRQTPPPPKDPPPA